MHDHAPPEPLLSRSDAARALAVSQNTLDRLLARGELPRVIIGQRSVRVPAAAVAAYIAARTVVRGQA